MSPSILSIVIRSISHMSTFTDITKILKQSLKAQKSNLTQLHIKLAFNIFHVVPNFANILTTVKIVKNSRRQRRSLSLNISKQPFKSSTKYMVQDKSIKSHLEILVSASQHWHRHWHSNISIVCYTIEIVLRAKT